MNWTEHVNGDSWWGCWWRLVRRSGSSSPPQSCCPAPPPLSQPLERAVEAQPPPTWEPTIEPRSAPVPLSFCPTTPSSSLFLLFQWPVTVWGVTKQEVELHLDPPLLASVALKELVVVVGSGLGLLPSQLRRALEPSPTTSCPQQWAYP